MPEVSQMRPVLSCRLSQHVYIPLTTTLFRHTAHLPAGTSRQATRHDIQGRRAHAASRTLLPLLRRALAVQPLDAAPPRICLQAQRGGW